MAQAARLNLRMQKELKLLLTDPPPSASFPSLSSDHHPSLTSIDAHFQGPDETVYANGVFKIKIQIPERYPFQPPIVTFATPIYHPNIDNGGRICLDILNLPPKGTWQPSLNISTVLTSIGLLLSEPNPDDGLMHEASREYKYNRQAFDQKARSMTEKYARIGNSEGSSSAQTENKGPDETICTNGHTETGEFRETKDVATGYSMNPDIRKTTGNKLSLKFPVVSHSTNGETTNMNMTNQCSSLLEANQVVENHKLESHSDENFRKPRHSPSVNQEQPSAKCVKTSPSKDSSEKRHSFPEHDFSQLDSSRNEKTNPRKDATPRDSRGSASFKLKKVSLQNEKENLVPKPFSSESGLYYNEIKGKQAVKMATKLPFKPLKQIVGNNGNIIMHSEESSGIISHNKQKINEDESVVVLDSEDSEDENVTVRSKLSLARRCLSRKRKSAIS